MTTAQAIVIAAALVSAALFGRAAFPRYEIQHTGERGLYLHIDRWTGRVEIATLRSTTAPWLKFFTLPETP